MVQIVTHSGWMRKAVCGRLILINICLICALKLWGATKGDERLHEDFHILYYNFEGKNLTTIEMTF